MISVNSELLRVPVFLLDFYLTVVLCILDMFSVNRAFVIVYAEVFLHKHNQQEGGTLSWQ